MKFGTVPPEPAVIADVSKLAPQMGKAVGLVLGMMRARGHTPAVRETIRTGERQLWLYGFGRSYDDGRGIVTNVDSIYTGWHPFGLAVDIVCARNGDNASAAFWQDLADAATAYGLNAAMRVGNSGGFFRRDRPHIQWGRCRLTPSWRSRVLYQSGGLPALWRACGAA